MKKYLLTLILLTSLVSFGQEYNLIHPQDTLYYEKVALSLDSIKIIDGDSIFYPFKCLIQQGREYYKINSSWIGKSITKKADGDHLIVTRRNDSLLIKNLAIVNDEWEVFRKNDTIAVAKVISVKDSTFLGLMDQIKTIQFTIKNGAGQQISSVFQNQEIIISKSYGLLKSAYFVDFPYSKPELWIGGSNILDSPQLLGLSNPKVGKQNTSWFDIHNHEIGDEIHIVERPYVFDNFDETRTYLTKDLYTDSIVYTVKRMKRFTSSPPVTVTIDTIKEVIKKNEQFDYLSSQVFFEHNFANSILKTEEKIITNIERELINDSCYNIPFEDYAENRFFMGIGGPFYFHLVNNDPWSGTNERSLVYYTNGSKTIGEPLDFCSVEPEEFSLPNLPDTLCTGFINRILWQASTFDYYIGLFDSLVGDERLLYEGAMNTITYSFLPSNYEIGDTVEALFYYHDHCGTPLVDTTFSIVGDQECEIFEQKRDSINTFLPDTICKDQDEIDLKNNIESIGVSGDGVIQLSSEYLFDLSTTNLEIEDTARINFHGEIDGSWWTITKEVRITCLVSGLFKQNLSDLSVDIYPNPSNGIFTLNLTGLDINQLALYNSTGEIVLQKEVDSEQVTLNSLTSGVYILELSGENESYREKIVVE